MNKQIEDKYKKIFFGIWEEGKSSDALMRAVENLIEEATQSTHVKGLEKEIADLKVENNYYLYGIEILKNLCALKHYKDTVGKDSLYEREQPEAWKVANDFLNTLVNFKELTPNK